jgi:transposase
VACPPHRRHPDNRRQARRDDASRDVGRLFNLRRAFSSIKLTWADGGYAGKPVTWAKTWLRLKVEIVKRPDDLHTFKVLPRRWVGERTFSWITRHRRTVRGLRAAGRPPRNLPLLVDNHRHDPAPRPSASHAKTTSRMSSQAGS